MMSEALRKIGEIGIIPVVVLNDVKDVEPLAKALIDGGLPCAEVTFRTDAAEESIRIITRQFPELFVGAGTVLTVDQADRAIDAGAKFIVTPGFNPAVVQHCIDSGITVCPGVCTPTEIEMALGKGIDTVKFFPAEPMGGLSYIKAVAAPYTTLKFMPTGGISVKNVRDYLAYDRILACGGSWMVKGDLIKSGSYDKITELVREAAAIVKEVRG